MILPWRRPRLPNDLLLLPKLERGAMRPVGHVINPRLSVFNDLLQNRAEVHRIGWSADLIAPSQHRRLLSNPLISAFTVPFFTRL